MAPQLKSSSRAVFLNIYRSLKYFTHVFDDPVELLSLTCTDFDSVFIVGDFNIHDEKPEDRGTKELRCVLNNFGLSRWHSSHTIEATSLTWLSQNISKVLVSNVVFSDHHCVFSESNMSVYTNVHTGNVNKPLKFELQRSNSKHDITENTSNIFSQAFSSTPLLSRLSVNGLADLFRSQIKFVIDAIAPTKVKEVSVEKKSLWRNATLVKMEWNDAERHISRFILTFIKRDFKYLVWNWQVQSSLTS